MGDRDDHRSPRPIDFVTLGMFIIDEIEYLPPTPPVKDIVGGAGAYSALGARLLSPAPFLSKSVGWIVDCGNDFPLAIRDLIASWQTSCLMRDTPERKTTRGWNGYNEFQERAFKYLTPKQRLDQDSLSSELLLSKSFHLICSPSRCIDLVRGITARRQSLTSEKPLIVWEPVPDLCTPTELDRCREALRLVDVVSPNHSELCAFFDVAAHGPSGRVARSTIADCCASWVQSGVGPDGAGSIVVRCGAEGCYLAFRDASEWLPAFHTDASKVVDPTGGGNTFLGGFSVNMVRADSKLPVFERVRAGAIGGSVAASFAIEQVGMPTLTTHTDSGELWNGTQVKDRIAQFRERCSCNST